MHEKTFDNELITVKETLKKKMKALFKRLAFYDEVVPQIKEYAISN